MSEAGAGPQPGGRLKRGAGGEAAADDADKDASGGAARGPAGSHEQKRARSISRRHESPSASSSSETGRAGNGGLAEASSLLHGGFARFAGRSLGCAAPSSGCGTWRCCALLCRSAMHVLVG